LKARPPGGHPAAADFLSDDASPNSCLPIEKQASRLPPLERYEPYLPDDKVVDFESVRIDLLAGHVQGPGRLGDLLRARWRP
jgi:hypothetical protein